LATHGRARAFKLKSENHAARENGGYYLVNTCIT